MSLKRAPVVRPTGQPILSAILMVLPILLLFCAGAVAAPQEAAAEAVGLTRLADGVFVSLGSPDGDDVGNAGVVLLDGSVLVFDTHFTPEAGRRLLDGIRAVTRKPVKYAVFSHFHPDHTHGTQAFSRLSQIIASTEARRDVLQKDVPAMKRMLGIAQDQVEALRKDYLREPNLEQRELLRHQIDTRQDFLDRLGHLEILAPTLTFDDSLSLVDDLREIRLRYLGAGHTAADIVLWLPAERILFLGDLFFNRALPNTQDANLMEWMKTLQEVLKLDARLYVPGHGPVGTREDVRQFLDYLQELRELVEPAVVRGDTQEQAIRAIQLPERYLNYNFTNLFPANVQRMYTELKALQLASPDAAAGANENKPGP